MDQVLVPRITSSIRRGFQVAAQRSFCLIILSRMILCKLSLFVFPLFLF